MATLLLANLVYRSHTDHIHYEVGSIPTPSESHPKQVERSHAEDILNLDPEVKAKVQLLSGPNTKADNPELLAIIRDYFIDQPRPFMTKFSLPLFQTNQAKVVDEILKGKVCFIFIFPST